MVWNCSDVAHMLDSLSNLGEQGAYLLADGLHCVPNLRSLDVGYHSCFFELHALTKRCSNACVLCVVGVCCRMTSF
jgi:hypothetical protein